MLFDCTIVADFSQLNAYTIKMLTQSKCLCVTPALALNITRRCEVLDDLIKYILLLFLDAEQHVDGIKHCIINIAGPRRARA